MTGTMLNCAGIIMGAILGLALARPPQRATEAYARILLAAFVVFYGLRLTWLSVNGPFLSILAQLLVVVLALALGKLLGKLIGLQKLSNRLGQFAKERIARAGTPSEDRFNDGFLTCTALFCAAPLAVVGAVQDGLSNYYAPLAVKGVIEGFAALGFARMFGWSVGLSFFPVLVFQGTITLLVSQMQPFLENLNLVGPSNAVGGLLVFCVALVILDLKKLPLADYLPSIAIAPLLTWLTRLI